MTFNYNDFGAATGALGLFGLLPILYAIIRFQLPSRKLKLLDEVLGETESQWREALEEGLILVAIVELGILMIDCDSFRHEASNLRAETHCATSFMQQCKAMLRGLSAKISSTCDRIKTFRADLSSTTAEARRRLLREGRYMPLNQRAAPQTMVVSSEQLSTPVMTHPDSPAADAVNATINNVQRLNSDDAENASTPPSASTGSDAVDSQLDCLTSSISRQRAEYRHASISTEPDSATSTSSASWSVFPADHRSLGHFSDASSVTLCEENSSRSSDVAASSNGSDKKPGSLASGPALYRLLCHIQSDLGARGQHHPLLSVAAEMARSSDTVGLPLEVNKGTKMSQETQDDLKYEHLEVDSPITSYAVV